MLVFETDHQPVQELEVSTNVLGSDSALPGVWD